MDTGSRGDGLLGPVPDRGDDFPDLRDARTGCGQRPPLVTSPIRRRRSGSGSAAASWAAPLDIVRERLEREFDLALITPPPTCLPSPGDRGTIHVSNPQRAAAGRVDHADEEPTSGPWCCAGRLHRPGDGAVPGAAGELVTRSTCPRSGSSCATSSPSARSSSTSSTIESRTRGYASLDYEPSWYGRPTWSRSTCSSRASRSTPSRHCPQGQGVRLRPGDDGQAQAADPAASSTRSRSRRHRGQGDRPRDHHARSQDVLAQCYGGDVTRKRKLLEPRRKASGGLQQIGRVDGPAGGVRRRPADRRELSR